MNPQRICPNCRKPLAADAPLGLCPECLVQAGFSSGGGPETDPVPPAFRPPPIAELARNFPQLEILELLGQGGMGAVYKARQARLNRMVALKILPPGIGNEPAFAQRFTREAQALAHLNHPGIVTLYEFGEVNGLFYFLMELVDGVSLRQLLHAGRISAREALAIVPQICDALQYAHDQGMVHRDIKPDNILLDRRGRVKVADFGLVKIIGNQNEGEAAGGNPAKPAATLTDAGKVMGTPQYMSPEQIAAPGAVDHRTDIYALGVVFYQMLTGELPGKKIEPPSRKVQIDVRLDEVVLRALEPKPELRYQQVSEVKTLVETIVSASGPDAPPAEPGVVAGAPTHPAGNQTPNAAGDNIQETPGGLPIPWRIWFVVAVLGLEGLGNLAAIPRQPEAIFWVAMKILFITGLLCRWRPVFIFNVLVGVIHVGYFAAVNPVAAVLNLVLVVLVGSCWRFYFGGKPAAPEVRRERRANTSKF